MFNFFKKKGIQEEQENSSKEQTEDDIQNLFNNLVVDELTIVIGNDIAKFTNTLIDKIRELREETANKNGFIMPLIHIKEDTNLQENEYIIKIRENNVFNEFVIPNEEKATEEIINNLKQICEEEIEEIFSLKITQNYIKKISETNEYLYYNIYNFYTVSSIKYVLVTLLKNKQSIKDISYIFEKMNEYATVKRIDKCYYCNYEKAAEYVLEKVQNKTRCNNI